MDSTQGGFRVAQETHRALLHATRQSADILVASERPCLLPPGLASVTWHFKAPPSQGSSQGPSGGWSQSAHPPNPIPAHTAQPPPPPAGERPPCQGAAQRLMPHPHPRDACRTGGRAVSRGLPTDSPQLWMFLEDMSTAHVTMIITVPTGPAPLMSPD